MGLLRICSNIVPQSRGIIIASSVSFPPSSSSLPPGLKPAHLVDGNGSPSPQLTPSSSITYPVYVLRPKDQPPARDLILSWNENDLFIDHLEQLTGSPENYHLYVITSQRRILRCGNQLSIKKVAQLAAQSKHPDGIVLGDHGHLELHMLSKGATENEWIQETKAAIS